MIKKKKKIVTCSINTCVCGVTSFLWSIKAHSLFLSTRTQTSLLQMGLGCPTFQPSLCGEGWCPEDSENRRKPSWRKALPFLMQREKPFMEKQKGRGLPGTTRSSPRESN